MGWTTFQVAHFFSKLIKYSFNHRATLKSSRNQISRLLQLWGDTRLNWIQVKMIQV